MLPTLAPGDRLLIHRISRIRAGDIVVFADPVAPSRVLVKRVIGVDANQLVVAGDNEAASRDSREFGPVPRALVVGRAWYRYFPSTDRERLKRGSPRS